MTTPRTLPDSPASLSPTPAKIDRRLDLRTTENARALAVAATKTKADAAIAMVAPVAAEMYRSGHTLGRIAAHLNIAGFRTRFGSAWDSVAVRRVLLRTGVYQAGGPDAADRRRRKAGEPAGVQA